MKRYVAIVLSLLLTAGVLAGVLVVAHGSVREDIPDWRVVGVYRYDDSAVIVVNSRARLGPRRWPIAFQLRSVYVDVDQGQWPSVRFHQWDGDVSILGMWTCPHDRSVGFALRVNDSLEDFARIATVGVWFGLSHDPERLERGISQGGWLVRTEPVELSEVEWAPAPDDPAANRMFVHPR